MNNRIVMEPSAKIREIACRALAGKWQEVCIGIFIVLAISVAPVVIAQSIIEVNYELTLVGVFLPLAVYVITGPLVLGVSAFVLRIFRKQPTGPSKIFDGFGFFWKSFLLYILMYIFIFLWSLLFIIPGYIAAFRYSLAFFVMADNPDMTALDCLKESTRLMKGNKAKLFCLNLSFIGWGFLWFLGVMAAVTVMGTIFSFVESFVFFYFLEMIIVYVSYVPLIAYMLMAFTAFYELVTGNLIVNKAPKETYDYM